MTDKALFLIVTSTMVLSARGGWYFSTGPSDFAEGFWGTFAVCLAILFGMFARGRRE